MAVDRGQRALAAHRNAELQRTRNARADATPEDPAAADLIARAKAKRTQRTETVTAKAAKPSAITRIGIPDAAPAAESAPAKKPRKRST